MFHKLVDTANDRTIAIIRVILGIVFFAHGAQKALGLFGGPGFSSTIGSFQQMGIPAWLAVLAIAAEVLGGLGLLVGLLSRIAALGIIVNMVVATLMVHSRVGFFMNWNGNQPGEGFEFHLLAIALGLAIVVKGAGAFSVDRILAT
ncbi:MAG TPA: DoxX family protein [Candidatus Binatia bacterium]|jgi:putative oxidoreductase